MDREVGINQMSDREKSSVSAHQVNSLIGASKYGHLVQLYLKKEPKKLKKYLNVRQKGHSFSLNQDVAVCALNDDVYSAKLIKIYCIADPEGTYIPIIQVQWYYTKQDLKIPEKYLRCISDKELFFSKHTEYLPANKLQCPIQVMTFEQYAELEYEEETTFFTRAIVDITTMEPQPCIKTWEVACVCRLPQNPDLQMIRCDKCEEWFHLECVGLEEHQVADIEIYKCPGCL